MMNDAYEEQGFGAIQIGFGERPAVLVVDFQLGFTNADQPLGGSAMVDAAVENTARLLAAARHAQVPVLQTYVGHCSDHDALNWKIPAVRTDFMDGTEGTRLDPRIHDPDYDVVFRKIAPSIFFQTPAVQILTKHQIDTVIIVGCNTSGCVRASAVDAFSYGFRTILPRDCCGDVEEGPHDQALRDIDRRYGDVITSQVAIAALTGGLEQVGS